MRNDKENIIVEKSFQFALRIVAYCELLEEKQNNLFNFQISIFSNFQINIL